MQRRLYLFNIHLGVETGTKGAVVEDTDDRKGIAVLYARGKIPFAGHSHNQFGAFLDDDLSGQGAARGNGNVDAVFLRHLGKGLDVAPAAADALVYGARDFNLAIEELQAMGE